MVRGSGRGSAKGRLPPKVSPARGWLGGTLGWIALSGRPRTVTATLGVLICPTRSMEPNGSVSARPPEVDWEASLFYTGANDRPKVTQPISHSTQLGLISLPPGSRPFFFSCATHEL